MNKKKKSLLFGQLNLLPEFEHHHLESPDLRKRDSSGVKTRCEDGERTSIYRGYASSIALNIQETKVT